MIPTNNKPHLESIQFIEPPTEKVSTHCMRTVHPFNNTTLKCDHVYMYITSQSIDGFVTQRVIIKVIKGA